MGALVTRGSNHLPSGNPIGASDEAVRGITDDMTEKLVHALEGVRKAQERDKVIVRGTVAALGSEAKLDVCLARGCDTHEVDICPTLTDKDLFNGLRRACEFAKQRLQDIRFPVLISSHIAYGIADLAWGGKGEKDLHSWSLGVANFVSARAEHFDGYKASGDSKLEARPRDPVHQKVWEKQARNGIEVWCAAYGKEHREERVLCLDALIEANELDPYEYPDQLTRDWWEELQAAWIEQLREKRRELCRMLGTDRPRKEDLKFLACAEDAYGGTVFRFPNVFDLADPDGYPLQVMIPRRERELKRMVMGQLNNAARKPAKAGGLDSEDGGKSSERPAYPAGKRLRGREATDSIAHAPKTKEGKIICWDAWAGCPKGKECNHAHEIISSTKDRHWTILAQYIRRGGLRSGAKIPPSEVDGRVAQLRAQAKAAKVPQMEE